MPWLSVLQQHIAKLRILISFDVSRPDVSLI